ncbi:MAG: MFS transporter [Candidatus Hydrothermales bacterium]
MNIRKNLNISLVEGVISGIHFGISNGVFITAFAVKIGALAQEVAFMSSLFNISFVFTFVSIFFLLILKRPMIIAGITGFISRGIWVIFLFEIFWNVKILFLVIFLSGLFLNISSTAWSFWFSNILKKLESGKGEYLGTRLGVITFFQSISFFIVGLIFEKVGFKSLFFILFLLSLLSLILYLFQDEIKLEERFNLKDYLKEVATDKEFMVFIFYIFIFNLLINITAPMFGYYAVKYMKLKNFEIALWTVSMGLGSAVFQPFWGKFIEKISPRATLKINLFFITTIPLIWIIRPAWMWYFIYLDGFLSTFGWSGINLAHSYINLMLIKNPIYQVVFLTVGGIGSFIGNNIGGFLVKCFINEEVGIKFSFFLSFLFRFFIALYLPKFNVGKIMPTKRAMLFIVKYLLSKFLTR